MLAFSAALTLALPLLAPPGAAPAAETGSDRETGPFTAARFREHAAFLASDDLRGRKAGSAGAAKAAEYVAARFKAARLEPGGDDRTYFQAFTYSDGSKCRNVLGVFPGAGALAEQHVIVSAHLDHVGLRAVEPGYAGDAVYNGADDNASGVAALLLMVEDLTRDRDRDGRPVAPRRAVVFAAFDAEELGLLGALRYAERPLLPLDQAAIVLNFDMIGRLAQGRLFTNDAETSAELAGAIRDLAKNSGVPVETRVGGDYSGDHAVFLRRRIPSVHFYTGLHADYHEVSDELAALDCEGGARVAALGSRVVRFAIGHPGRFEYRRVDPTLDLRGVLSLARRLGVIPALGSQEGHYPRLLLVVPGSLADRKGLKPGDEITAINGVALARIEEAVLVVAQLRFDQGQRMTVRRGGTSFEFHAAAGEFPGLEGPRPIPLPGDRFEVTFRYTPPAGTEEVSLLGNFGAYQATELKKMDGPGRDGSHTTRLVLNRGEYRYNFQCRGKGTAGSYPDPENLQQDEFGNSLLRVGTTPQGGQIP